MRRYKKRNNERINQVIIGLFLVSLMVFSTVGYILNYRDNNISGSQNFEYNNVNYDVDVNNNVLFTEVDGERLVFYNYPDSVIQIPDEAVSDILSANAPGPIFTFDPSVGLYLQVVDSLRSDLDDLFLKKNVFLSHGVHKQVPGPYSNFPILDCENASQGSPVIKFINSSTLNVEYEDYCLQMYGSNNDLFELRDSVIYSLYGLI